MITRRERVRQAAIEELKEIAWEIIHEQGIDDVTVNGITKRMGMTPPAFYSYFKSRDDFLKELVMDSYDSFQEALETARNSIPTEKTAQRIFAMYVAYRDWAIASPVAFGLFAGRPVPGFNPPEERFLKRADKIHRLFVDMFQDAWQQQKISLPQEAFDLPDIYQSQLMAYQQRQELSIPEALINVTLHLGCLVHGMISMEISKRIDHFVKDMSHFYRFQVANELKRIGLNPE